MKLPSSIIISLIASGNLVIATAVIAQGRPTPPEPPGLMKPPAQQADSRIPIASLPFTITNAGSYYLTTNLAGVSGMDGITITADNVTLDLNGFALVGVAGSTNGIIVARPARNLIVRNGNVSGWEAAGVNAYDNGSNALCERLAVSDCGGGIALSSGVVSDCTVSSCKSDGIDVNESGTISGCNISSCGGNGIDVEYGNISSCTIQSCDNYGVAGALVTVSDSSIAFCNVGIDINQGTVSRCSVQYSKSDGIQISTGTVSGCPVERNGARGIVAGGDGGCLITGNTCFDNNTSGNPSYAGISIFYSNNRIEDNNVSGNGVAGIEVYDTGISSNNVIIKNTVSGNGANNYVVPGNQVVGPIITTAGTITNCNPWANFSF